MGLMAQPEHRRKKSRGRATLFWALFGVVAGQLLLGWLVDYPLRGHRFRPEIDPATRTAAQALGGRAPVLCLGSSRLGCALRSDLLNPAWEKADLEHAAPFLNLAVAASTPPAMREVHASLIQQGVPRPRLALVEVSPETITHRHPFFYFDCYRHFTTFEWLSLLPYHLDDSKVGPTAALRLNPAYEFRRVFGSFLRAAVMPPRPAEMVPVGNQHLPSLFYDAVPELGPKEQAAAIAGSVRKVKKWLRTFHPGGPNLRELNVLVRDLRDQGSAVILVAPPVSQEHRAAYSSEVETAFRAAIDRLCDRHGCSFLDCRDWAAEVHFSDSHHLVAEGAALFSRRFIDQVLRPFVREGRLAGR